MLLLPQCVQVYCMAGVIHPGITSVWTDGLVWLEWCWKRPKIPNNAITLTFENNMMSNGSLLLPHCFQSYCIGWLDSPRTHEYVNCRGDWTDITAVENGLKLRKVHAKRPLKTWRAMATLTTLFSVLSRRWVDSPRKHVCVCEQWRVFNRNAVVNGLKKTNNAIKTTFENMTSNGSSYRTVFSPIA